MSSGTCKMTSRKRHYSSSSESDNERYGKRKSENQRRSNSKPESISREHKSYHRNGGNQHKNASDNISVDSSWLRKALKRAKEQAADENKSLEEIAAIRWGSLEKFYSLLDEAEGRTLKNKDKYSCSPEDRGKYKKEGSCKERRPPSHSRELSGRNINDDKRDKKSISNRMMRPVSDDEDNSVSMSKSVLELVSSSSQKGWRKKREISEEEMISRKNPPSLPSRTVKERSPLPEKEAISAESKSPPTILTDQELNKLAAKLTKAEITGNDILAQKLKAKLAAARDARNSNTASNPSTKRVEEEILLTKTMPSGYTAPVTHSQPMPAKKKHKMAAFLEENRSLKQMFEHEKCISAADQIEVAEEAALHMGPTMEEDYDDVGGSSDALHKQIGRLQDKQRQRAIVEHQSNERSLDQCTRCIVNKEMAKHLIVALGTKCYVALLPHEELASGQCVIVPIHHVQSSLLADEDLWDEIMNYRKDLVNFYTSRDEDCIFFETYLRSTSRIPHMSIQCIPLPREVGDLSPIYFKKAIDECEGEWSQNKKLVNLKGKGMRKCLPKELSYFFVDFGNCPGYGHVIEDERTFPRTFAQEIVGGMLDAEKFLWLRPPKQSFDVQCKKVMQFIEDFKLFDHTTKKNQASNSS